MRSPSTGFCTSAPPAADAPHARLRTALTSLLQNPWTGHQRETLAPASSGIRFKAVMNLFLIVHRVVGDEVDVLHVYDARRDVAGLLRGDRPA